MLLKLNGNKSENLKYPPQNPQLLPQEPECYMRSMMHPLGPNCASCVGCGSVTSGSNNDHLVVPQSEKFTSVNFIFHVKNLLKGYREKAKNNQFAVIFGTLGNSHFLCKSRTY